MMLLGSRRYLTYVFNKVNIFLYSRSPLHIASYALRIRVSVIELYDSEFLISHTFRYISIAHKTGNFIMYALGLFSLGKRSHI